MPAISRDQYEFLKRMRQNDYQEFRDACKAGDGELVGEWLARAQEIDAIEPRIRFTQEMLQANEFEPIVLACKNGNLEIFNKLVAAADRVKPGFTASMIKTFIKEEILLRASEDFSKRYLSVVSDLNLIPDIVDTKGFRSTFEYACGEGNLDLIDFFLAITRKSDEKNPGSNLTAEMISRSDFRPLQFACSSGQAAAVNKLLAVCQEFNLTNQALSCKNFSMLRGSIQADSFEVFNNLLEAAKNYHQENPTTVDLRLEMLRDPSIIVLVFESGNIRTVDRLLAVAQEFDQSHPGFILNMMQANNFNALTSVFSNTNIEVVDRILEVARELDPTHNLVVNMMQANNSNAYRLACVNINPEVFDRLLAFAKEIDNRNPGLDLVSNMMRDNLEEFKQVIFRRNKYFVKKLFQAYTKLDPTGNFWKRICDQEFLHDFGSIARREILKVIPHNYLLEKVRTNAYPGIDYDNVNKELTLDETQIRLVNLAFEIGQVRGSPLQEGFAQKRVVLMWNMGEAQNVAERTNYAKALSYYRIVDEAYHSEQLLPDGRLSHNKKLPIEEKLIKVYKKIKDRVTEYLKDDGCYAAAKQSLDISREQIAIFEARRVIVDILENYDQIENFRLYSFDTLRKLKEYEQDDSHIFLPMEMKLKIMDDVRVDNVELYSYKSEFGSGIDNIVNIVLREDHITAVRNEVAREAENIPPRLPDPSPAGAGAASAAAASRDGGVVSPS